MVPSVSGFLVLAGLLLLGRRLGAPIIIALFASLPLGSTAIVTLSALGGSSPLIYTALVVLLLASVSLRRGFLDDLVTVFANYRTAWVLGALILYSIFSAIVFPRLFAGQTIVFVASPDTGVQELQLAPVSGNITQTGYFVLGALAFFAFTILLERKGQFEAVRRGFFAWVVVHACLGVLDLLGKVSGIGDILSPIRTANYTYLVEVEEVGFWRIAGGFSEASAFGSVTLGCLAFCFTYWRVSGSRSMFGLTLLLSVLLLLSTSSTAYAGLAIVAPFAALSMFVSAFRGKLSRPDIAFVCVIWLGLIALLSSYLLNERLFDPFVTMLDAMVLNKAASESAQVRMYWNWQSMKAFFDTVGLGVGLGSSRAASWVVAVLSQLGIVGGLMIASLVGVLFWDMVSQKPQNEGRSTLALVSGARASALASLAGASVSSGSADPGLLLFIALAVVTVYRKRLPRDTMRQQPMLSQMHNTRSATPS